MSDSTEHVLNRIAKKSRAAKLNNAGESDHITGSQKSLRAADLDDRKIRGVLLHKSILDGTEDLITLGDQKTLYVSSRDKTRVFPVERNLRNLRGTLTTVYACSCPDFIKNGRTDCSHIFAERLRRSEVIVVGEISRARARSAKATRRPARKLKTDDGRSYKAVDRHARVAMGDGGIERLASSLLGAYNDIYPTRYAGKASRSVGGQTCANSLRAMCLVLKVASGKSSDEMVGIYRKLIENGQFRLKRPPHQNTLSDWFNDPLLTPILHELLRITSLPFRKREIGAIIDSTKLSQMRSAHSRWVEYGEDVRSGADWMKAHALVGVETMIVMGVTFSGNRNSADRGSFSHDINFVKPLVELARHAFQLEFFLGDKAYLSEEIVGWLFDKGIRAVIPVKKGWNKETKTAHYEACAALVEWYDKRQSDFHEHYRLRPKIESLFSHLKRLSQGYCWSRGRSPQVQNADTPCDAWINEALCKFIYVNLRTAILYGERTGYAPDYRIAERFFPPPSNPLLTAA